EKKLAQHLLLLLKNVTTHEQLSNALQQVFKLRPQDNYTCFSSITFFDKLKKWHKTLHLLDERKKTALTKLKEENNAPGEIASLIVLLNRPDFSLHQNAAELIRLINTTLPNNCNKQELLATSIEHDLNYTPQPKPASTLAYGCIIC
ncbi:MAG: hypothetical protein PSV35_01510, partial [bacterium]|nr:hypothetical protein [bacterium]